MDQDIKFECTALDGQPYELLAEHLDGRIDSRVSVADDTGLVAAALEKSGRIIDRRSDYSDIRENGAVSPALLDGLLRDCGTQWVLAVAEASDTGEKAGIVPTSVTRLELRDALNSLSHIFTYKTIASGDLGCFVVSCGKGGAK